jgi:hypothetical protein
VSQLAGRQAKFKSGIKVNESTENQGRRKVLKLELILTINTQ